ncbi:WD40 repeat-like protein [Gloeophyllum trabeum ATCC 11539]|uniref:WD40 repeat-like protein n=1 Tax=Gloeophyllum trabeum (strain ATCC 11539 / FP-39264 / Madison 617) TaxID=670483 RepID=S7PS39_GLOTA|nr:WD40 repeat-like protein [Gloeophyllum trabeum ATCC 11539]EPQ50208.1 WD40 repeat-like protein [Gloeophyllum trabeum ATCC 11539]
MFKVSWLFDFSTPVRLVAPRVERSPIFALAISPSAKFLASGGEYGVQLWSLKDYAPIATPITSGLRGPTSSIAWLEREIGETLVYGTALGWLGCWRQNSTEFKELCAHRTGEGCEIASLATDAGTCRIASAARDGSIQVWTFNAEESLISLFSVRLDRTTPICVAFKDNTTKDIFVFGIYDGERFVLRGNDGKILSRETTNIMMGRVAVSSKRRQYVLDNGMDGFDVRDLENNAHVVRLPTDRVKVSRPKQVAFANDDTLVVGGSDHGVIYVFDRTTGIVLDKYTHSKGGLVQTIATHDIGDDIIIAGATSGEGSDPYISLWRYKVPRTARSALLGNVVATAYSLARFLRVLLVAVAYLWDIIGFIGIFCSLFPVWQTV